MSRPMTPVSGVHGSMAAPPEGSVSARPAYSTSKPNSYLGAVAPGSSGYAQSEHLQGAPKESSILAQSVNLHDDGLEATQLDSPQDVQRAESRMSQSQYTPSRSGTLKKKASLKRTGSLGRTPSRRSSYAGSVKSVRLGEKEKQNAGEASNSAFFCPVPTSGNPTELLANRFQAWRKVLKDLINYFRELSKGYDTRSKTFMGSSAMIGQITTPSNFLPSGGLGDATSILRDFHKQGIADANKARDVENEIVMQLTGLRSDLQQKIKEIKGLSGDFKNSVDKEQENTKKSVRSLQEALGLVDVDAAATSGKGDPFIIKLGVDRQLEKHIEEENYLHRAYLNLESSGRELESIVVGEIQKAYNAFAAILKREADEAYETSEKLREGPLAMVKDHEWDHFTSTNPQMVDPKIPVRELKNITYPGKEHPAAIEVRSGMLERKSKYLKNYTPGWYVLSPTHLHEFKSADRIAFQSPVMSLYLPEQKLGSHSEPSSSSHKFMLKGRQSGSMHRGHAWVFRAESYDTMMAWFGDVKELTEKTGEARNAFVRKTHARSVSGNSLRPSLGAASSNDGMEEDEADKVPYSSEQSVRGPSMSAEATTAALGGVLGVSAIRDMEDNRSEVGWRPPQDRQGSARPSAGGRFPSDINITRGLEAPQSPSSGGGFETRDEDHDVMMAAGALPGSGVPFMNSTGRHTELQPADETTYSGNELAGAAGSAAHGDVPYTITYQHPQQGFEQTGHQYGDFRHPPAPVSSAADGTSQYGEWMSPVAAGTTGAAGGAIVGGGAVAGAAGLKHHHDKKKEQQAAAAAAASREPSTHPEPIENIENSKRQMEASSAVPAHGTSSPPIPVPVATDSMASPDAKVSNFPEPERSLSRPRGITESTMATTGTAITAAPTIGASSGYGESLSTVPTSVDDIADNHNPSVLVSGGAWEKNRATDGALMDSPVEATNAAPSGWGAGMMGQSTAPAFGSNGTPAVKEVMGANGTTFIPDRPKPISSRSVQTISDLHVPGEFPKAVM